MTRGRDVTGLRVGTLVAAYRVSTEKELIGKSYNQAYHLLVTREVALEDLLC